MFEPQVVSENLDKDHLQYLKSRGISKDTAKVVKLFGSEKYFQNNKKQNPLAFRITRTEISWQ